VINLDERIPDRIVGDALRLSQILNNLVSNAVKFTDEGQVTVDISLKETSANKLDLYFKIQDTGIGIPEHKLAAVFEDFVQVNEETLRQGTGLGLSTYGKGTTFSFNLVFEKIEPIAGSTIIPQKNKAKTKMLYSKNAALTGVQLLLVTERLLWKWYNRNRTMWF